MTSKSYFVLECYDCRKTIGTIWHIESIHPGFADCTECSLKRIEKHDN